MQLVRKRDTRKLTNCVYRHGAVRDAESAADFIVRAAGLPGYSARYIALRDPDGGEDNDSCQLRSGASAQEILEALGARSCQRLYLSGQFEGVRAGIGIDLNTWEITITGSGEQLACLQKLAGLLA